MKRLEAFRRKQEDLASEQLELLRESEEYE
jgi:hypothetical protein